MVSTELLTQLVSALGPMGFVMWLVHRTTTHTIPRLAKQFEEATERARQDYVKLRHEEASAMRELVAELQEEKRLLLSKLLGASKDGQP